MMGNARGLSPLVIPGRAKREPGIHIPDRGYGFRVQPCGLPRNDERGSDGYRLKFSNSQEQRVKLVIASQQVAFVAGNDDQTQLRDLAAYFRASFAFSLAP